MRLPLLVQLAVCAWPMVAMAEGCHDLRAFALHGEPPQIQAQDVTCGQSQALGGGTSKHCIWTYDLRAGSAQATFEALRTQLLGCAQAESIVSSSPVNHPDTFDQVTGEFDQMSISIALKDKTALGKSLIVLRAQKADF